jgi:rhamnose utilization protein RhaD (predicted bifunctional aldolase and dehydrogenase)
VTALNEQGATAVAKLSLADGGEANFTVEAEVGEDLGFDVPLVRPGFQLGRQLGRVTYGVFHIQLEASEPT